MSARRGSTDPALARLVEQQMRNWELARSQKQPAEPENRPEVEDFVCISRDVGADRIGLALGKRLGWPVFDREILNAMAGDDAIRKQLYASLDERDVGWCEEVLRPLMQPGFVKNDYFHQLTSTILSLARTGNAVFVGRGADLILPRATGLRVRVVEPLASRIRRVAGELALSADDARHEIQRLETERAAYINQHFQTPGGDPERFDLVLNLARISKSQAVDIIATARATLRGSLSA